MWLFGGACVDFLWIVASVPKRAHHVGGLEGFCHLPRDTHAGLTRRAHFDEAPTCQGASGLTNAVFSPDECLW